MSTPVPPIIDQEEQTRRALQERQLREQQEKIQGLLGAEQAPPLQFALGEQAAYRQDMQDPVLRGAIRDREHADQQEAFQSRSKENLRGLLDMEIGGSDVRIQSLIPDPSRDFLRASRALLGEVKSRYEGLKSTLDARKENREYTEAQARARLGISDPSQKPTDPGDVQAPAAKTIAEPGDEAQAPQSTGNPSETINQTTGSGKGSGEGPPTADGPKSWQAEHDKIANETVDRISRRAMQQIEQPDLSPTTPEQIREAMAEYKAEADKMYGSNARAKVDQLLTKMESVMNSPAIPEDKRSKMAKIFLEVIPLAILAGLGRMDVVQMILGMKQQKVQDALAARKQKLGELGVLAGAYGDQATREESKKDAFVQNMLGEFMREQRDAKGNKLDLYEAQLMSADRNRGHDIDERRAAAAEQENSLRGREMDALERARAEAEQQKRLQAVESQVRRQLIQDPEWSDKFGSPEYEREVQRRAAIEEKRIMDATYGASAPAVVQRPSMGGGGWVVPGQN